MSVVFSTLWRIWFVLVALTATVLCFPFAWILSLHPQNFSACYVVIRLWCLMIFYGVGFRYTLISPTGKMPEPRKQYVIIANHTSLIDIMLMCVLHPHHPICFVGKKEISRIPLVGTIYKRVSILVDRKSLRSRARVYDLSAERISEGQNMVIFPEGGVSDDPAQILGSFKDGAFSLATKYKIPVVVYTFIGVGKMFPFNYFHGHPGRIPVILNDILVPGEDKENLKKTAYHLILTTLNEKK